jgi:hypothetical protein
VLSTLYSCQILKNLEFSRLILENARINIFPVGVKLFHTDVQSDGRTKKHDEINNHFTQFCECALKTNNLMLLGKDTWLLSDSDEKCKNILSEKG